MKKIIWMGRLSWWLKLLLNINCMMAWLTGRLRNAQTMKRSVVQGYDGVCTDHVSGYDKFGVTHYSNISKELLKPFDLRDSFLLDVGCGTGISSLYAWNRGAAQVLAVDLSAGMLKQLQYKLNQEHYDVIRLVQADAESLPFKDKTFDIVYSSMMLGFLPDPKRVIEELHRVVRRRGYIAIAAHGPNHYWEAVDAAFRVATKRYMLAKRLEYWPFRERDLEILLSEVGLVDIEVRSLLWQERFDTGGEAFDFFAATSATWWATKLPKDKRQEEVSRMRKYFDENGISNITSHVIFAYAQKPLRLNRDH
jgi:ubiquinone/menaquinone biosynthesis C-methylase UbiE